MKQPIKSALSAALCVGMGFLAACGAQPGGSESGPGAIPQEVAVAQAKGRYMERRLPFPEGLTTVLTLDEVAENTLYAIGRRGSEPDWEVWHSADAGESWEQESPAWLEELAGLYFTGAAFTPEGGAYLSYGVNESEDENDPDLTYHTVYADNTGVREIEGIEALTQYNNGLSLAPTGELIVNQYFSLDVIDLATGKTRQFDHQGMYWPGSFVVYDDTLAASTSGGMVLMDYATGKERGRIDFATGAEGIPSIAVQPDRSGFFYCEPEGLYRVTMDGSLTEQIIDGALASFGLPAVSVSQLTAGEDGSFTLLCYRGDSGYELLRYEYDPDISRVPEGELDVYTLEGSDSMRQAVGMFQAANPDIMVNYRVGLTGNDAVTAADALRTLSTELLAGAGPDILVLDGMPLESYVGKGALLDMEELLADLLEDQLLPGVAGAYRTEAGLYAVPSRFSLPILAAEGADGVATVAQLLDWLATQGNPQIGVPQELLLEHFYDVGSLRWFSAGGALDTAALTEDLAAMRRYTELLDSLPHVKWASVLYMSMYYGGEGIGAMQAPVNRLGDFANALRGIEMRGEGTLRAFPRETDCVFIPRSILAINAAAPRQETARDFVRFALSQEAQMPFEDGFAVNLAALEADRDSRRPGANYTSLATYDHDTQESYDLDSHWPGAADMDRIFTMLHAASTPVMSDAVLRAMIIGEAEGYLAGDKPLEDTVSSLSQKVERYLQEKE